MTRKIDLIGERFGELVVIAAAHSDRYGHAMWWCRCSCSKERPVSTTNLRTRHTTSCGHMKQFRLRDYVLQNGPTNVKYADPLVKIRNAVISSYKGGATSRGLAWELTQEQALALFASDCYFCGSPPTNLKKRCSGDGKFEFPFWYNGIDRLDSTQGYYPANVVSCCKVCNRAKSDMPYAGFCAWLARVAFHNQGQGRCVSGACEVKL